MADLVTDGAFISHSIVAAHRVPGGAPWMPACTYCADGRCSALDEAVQHLAELRQRSLASGAAFYGRR